MSTKHVEEAAVVIGVQAVSVEVDALKGSWRAASLNFSEMEWLKGGARWWLRQILKHKVWVRSVDGKMTVRPVLFFPEEQEGEDGWCTQMTSSLGRGLLDLTTSCVTSGKSLKSWNLSCYTCKTRAGLLFEIGTCFEMKSSRKCLSNVFMKQQLYILLPA